jgi:leader peptidase (prepilin peptidase)/N-methyltransferase
LGAFISGAFLFLLRLWGNRILKKESLGMGDVKLGAVIGFYLGFTDFLLALIAGSLIAILASIIRTRSPDTMKKTRIPLAPYLTLGILLVLFFS